MNATAKNLLLAPLFLSDSDFEKSNYAGKLYPGTMSVFQGSPAAFIAFTTELSKAQES